MFHGLEGDSTRLDGWSVYVDYEHGRDGGAVAYLTNHSAGLVQFGHCYGEQSSCITLKLARIGSSLRASLECLASFVFITEKFAVQLTTFNLNLYSMSDTTIDHDWRTLTAIISELEGLTGFTFLVHMGC